MSAWLPWKRHARSSRESVSSESFGLLLTFYQRDPAYSLGLAALSAYAKREIADLRVYLVPIFPHDSVAAMMGIVEALQPDLIAVSAMSPTWLPVDPYIRGLKRALPSTPILVGGYQAIVSPQETITHPAVDYVCVGDGEEPLVALIRRLRAGADAADAIPGLWAKAPGGQVITSTPVLVQDLTALPLPDYTIFDRDGDLHYLSPRAIQSRTLTTVPVISGRGCPYRCTYCANTTLLNLYRPQGGYLRKYDPEALVDELVGLRDRYHVGYFQFWDEEFLYERRYAQHLLDLYRREVRVPFSMFARVENMNEKLCQFAASAGCHSMWFGIESGSESYRRRYLHRNMTNRAILEAASTARSYGIKLFAFNMVGTPFETLQDVRDTLELTRAIDPELTVFSQFLPLPGTPLYELCREHELLLDPSIERQMWPLGTLNIREHPGGLTNVEMHEVAAEIMQYLADHTRFDD